MEFSGRSVGRIAAVVGFACVLTPAPAQQVGIARAKQEYRAHVVGITDGDTLTVLTADKKEVRIRLHGIDCPETGQDFGNRAKQRAAELAFGRDVQVKERDSDRYGRTVAEVVLPGGRSLNQELVRDGLAWWYRQYAPGDAVLGRLENEARSAKRGLWSMAAPVEPWQWRRSPPTPTPATREPIAQAVVGNQKSRAYHSEGCASIAKMASKNRVNFASAAAAAKAGFQKAGDCK